MPNHKHRKSAEDQEQEAFVQWLRLGYPHFRVPNDIHQVVEQAKNKLGVSSGVRIYLWRCCLSASTSNHRP